MKNLHFLLLLVAALAACTQESAATKTPSIAGMDLSQIQSADYFRAHLDGAKELSAWCVQNVNPADTSSDERVIRNLKNCENASTALVLPDTGDIRKGKVYKVY